MASITRRFGIKVRKLRRRKEMSQLDLAQKSRLDLETINEIENGQREAKLRTVWKIANALKVSLKDLF